MEMSWYKCEFDVESDTLVIALGSFIENNEIPQNFEWSSILNTLSTITPFKKLFIRDLDYAWWQTKFYGDDLIGYGPKSLAKFIDKMVKKSGVKKTLIVGVSLGGYGAILFGCLCKLDLAISISPQTYLTKSRYIKYNLYEKYKNFNINKEETDLKIILEKYGNNHTEYDIYFGKYNRGDSKYASRISNFSGVKLFPLESDKHTVSKLMKQEGLLQNIIIQFVKNSNINKKV
jgi:predicted esterase YcpF (UPF0227 family)